MDESLYGGIECEVITAAVDVENLLVLFMVLDLTPTSTGLSSQLLINAFGWITQQQNSTKERVNLKHSPTTITIAREIQSSHALFTEFNKYSTNQTQPPTLLKLHAQSALILLQPTPTANIYHSLYIPTSSPHLSTSAFAPVLPNLPKLSFDNSNNSNTFGHVLCELFNEIPLNT